MKIKQKMPDRIVEKAIHYTLILSLLFVVSKAFKTFQPIDYSPGTMVTFLMLAIVWETHRYRIRKLERKVEEVKQ